MPWAGFAALAGVFAALTWYEFPAIDVTYICARLGMQSEVFCHVPPS